MSVCLGKVDEKATQLHAIASLKVLLDATKPQRGAATSTAANNVRINYKETTLVGDRPNGNIDTTLDSVSCQMVLFFSPTFDCQLHQSFFIVFCTSNCKIFQFLFFFSFNILQSNDLEEPSEPLSMAWPKEGRKRLSYVLVAPILVPLWLTLPDTRTPRGKRFFVVTFLGSITWIAAYSYLMVWWANVFGETADIPPEVRLHLKYHI